MSLITVYKKTVTVAVGVAATDVDTISGVLGATGIKIYARNGSTPNNITVSVSELKNGTVVLNPSIALNGSAGPTNAAPRRFVAFEEWAAGLYRSPYLTGDTYKITATAAVGATNVTFDIYVLAEKHLPSHTLSTLE